MNHSYDRIESDPLAASSSGIRIEAERFVFDLPEPDDDEQTLVAEPNMPEVDLAEIEESEVVVEAAATIEEPPVTIEEPPVTIEEPSVTIEEPSVTIEEASIILTEESRELLPYREASPDAFTLVGLGPDTPRPSHEPVRELLPARIDDMTLVGLGPPSSRSPVVLETTQITRPRAKTTSEPPGPWGSNHDHEPPAPPRRLNVGIWAAAVPLLMVAVAVIVFALRALAPSAPPAHANAAQSAASPSHESTGIFVRLANPDVLVAVDGKDQGAPPVLLMDLEPGSHVLSITGDGYEPYEQTFTLSPERVSTLEPVLTKLELSDPPRAKPKSSGLGHGPSRTRAIPVKLEETPTNPYARALESTPGLLAASSNPPSMVIVDGRTIGKSPRAVELPAGIHTVVFVHSSSERLSLTVNVTPGKTANAAVDF